MGETASTPQVETDPGNGHALDLMNREGPAQAQRVLFELAHHFLFQLPVRITSEFEKKSYVSGLCVRLKSQISFPWCQMWLDSILF